MRTIEKSREPLSLKRHRKSGGTYENYRETEDLRSALLKDQGHICCYCMKRITARDMKNEHWASQTDHDDETVDWDNLMGSCKGGDGERGAIRHCDTSRGHTRLKVNPLDQAQRCERLIQYRADGEISSRDPEINKDLGETLNLNNERLKPMRGSVYDTLFHRLKIKANEFGIRATDRWPRDIVEPELAAWKRRDKAGQYREYCQIAIYVLEKKLPK